MLNKIVFYILTRFFQVDQYMVNPVNWRVANEHELISKFLGYAPLIYKGNKHLAKYGFENFVFLAAGQVYLCPKKLDEKYHNTFIDPNIFSTKQFRNEQEFRNEQIVPFSLLKHYMENDPHVLVPKFPTKLYYFY